MPLDPRARSRHRRPLSAKLLIGIAASLAASPALHAASGVWSGAADSAWSNVSNWSATPVPGAGDTATFNSASGNTTVDLGAGVTIGAVVFDTVSAAAYTIGSGGAGGQTLTLGTVGNAITLNPTVAADQLFNSNLALAVTRTAGNAATYYTATNNSAANTLALAGGISASTTGIKVLHVTGSGATAVSGAIASGAGNVSLFKTGAGTLTLSGGATFSGNGVTDGANFASSAVFREGLTIFNGGTYNNSGGEPVIGGVATHGGAGTNTTLQLDNAIFNNISWLSIGRGNGNGTATSNLVLNGSSSISATNMSAGFNAGNGANIPKGSITLNGTSSLTLATNFQLGESPGANFTMSLNDSSSVTVGAGTIYVGNQNGTGTLNVNGASTFTTNGEIRVAFSAGNGVFTGSGTLNVNGGTVSTRALTVARNNNDVASTLNATVNVNSGTFEVKDQQTLIGWRGTQSTGTLNINGGAFNHGTVATGNFVVGSFAGTAATVNVSGGALTLQRNSNLLFSNQANANAVRTLTIGGGNVTFYSDAGASVGGTGVIDLMNTSNPTGTSTLNLDGGTLTANQIKATSATGTRVVNFNGGTLKAGSGNATLNAAFLANGVTSSVNVRNGGAIIDTNDALVTIAQALTHSAIGGDAATDGGLTKQGGGTLTLTGVNTYTGDTTINSGGLTLADDASIKFVIGATGVSNKVVGSGSFTVDGDFVFDLTGAGTTVGDSWQIVNAATLNETFGTTFTVPGFTINGAKWFRPDNGAFYEFDPATGVLSVISDPDISYPPPTATAGNYGTAYSVGSDIVLSATASGIGDLTYQWYYQAVAGATPVAIEGATGPTLTVSGATAAASGIYSLVVTDHAAEASGKPATTTTIVFSTITVQPVGELAVALYRFEDGANGASVSPALDSVGGNNLSLLGAATYSSASLPYATIPATGAANTLGAAFPASGNNGLVAAVNGTLATTAFTDFTVEAFVRFSDLAGTQTIVGRDDSLQEGSLNLSQGLGGQGLFYLSKSAAGFRVELITKDNRNIQINSTINPTLASWYHIAAVGNVGTGTLKLYVNGALVGTTTGFNGLFVPASGSDTPWTVGRGDFNLTDVDFFRGDIDEVRITRAALIPSQFLNSAGGVAVVPPTVAITPNYTSVYPGADVLFTATATSNMSGTLSYQWYKDGVALDGETGATLSRPAVSLATGGMYGVVVTDSAGASLGSPLTTTVTARLRVLDIPAAGARSLGLNFVGAGIGNWSTELGIMAAGQSAGVYPMTNWNNSASVTGVSFQNAPLTLKESNGSSAAAVTATWDAAAAWSARTGTGTVANKTPNGLLLHGYIESRLVNGSTVTISNIPYGAYDVYVHVAGGGNGEVGSMSINREGSPTYYYRVLQHDGYVVTPTPDVLNPYTVPLAMGESLTRVEALTTAPATFVRFEGVTGYDLTISAIDSIIGRNAGGIAAIEIVDRSPAGAASPILVTSAPASRMVQGGANVTLAITASSVNSGTLAYQWKKDDVDITGETGTTLTLNAVTGASSGNYSVVITETSAFGTRTASRAASLIVVDATRSLLINGDLNAGNSPTFSGNGILRANGGSTAADLGSGSTAWNGILGAAGAATRALGKDSTGLPLPSVIFSYADAGGVEDNASAGGIASSAAVALSRDYLYTDNQTTPITATVGGLQALAGKQVTLVVYAYGKLSTAFFENGVPGDGTPPAGTSDAATVTLVAANNHLGSTPKATTTISGTFQDAGRKLEDNNLETTADASAAYVTFTGVVDKDGKVSWKVGADLDAGRIPLVGFQLLVTHVDVAPAVPTGLNATAGTGQVSLSWNASADATSYTIKRATSLSGPYATISEGAVTGLSYTDNGLTAGTTYYYTVAAANSLAQSADSAPVSATPASPLSALQTWRQSHFGTTANEGDAANAADPDHDGQANLLEYALGTDPKAAGSSPVTVGRSGSFLTLGFTHIGDDTLVYLIEASNDLASWSPAHTYPAFTTAGTETYTDTVALGAQTRRFLRLVVTAP